LPDASKLRGWGSVAAIVTPPAAQLRCVRQHRRAECPQNRRWSPLSTFPALGWPQPRQRPERPFWRLPARYSQL